MDFQQPVFLDRMGKIKKEKSDPFDIMNLQLKYMYKLKSHPVLGN